MPVLADNISDDYDRGKREGRIDALLESHSRSIMRIDGNIERFSAAIDHLTLNVRDGISSLSDGLRTLQEEGRARDLAVSVAADTLAKETERRRGEAESLRVDRAAALEAPVRAWGIRASMASVFYLAIAVGAIVVTILTATGHL